MENTETAAVLQAEAGERTEQIPLLQPVLSAARVVSEETVDTEEAEAAAEREAIPKITPFSHMERAEREEMAAMEVAVEAPEGFQIANLQVMVEMAENGAAAEARQLLPAAMGDLEEEEAGETTQRSAAMEDLGAEAVPAAGIYSLLAKVPDSEVSEEEMEALQKIRDPEEAEELD
jgi:hypothetical protein